MLFSTKSKQSKKKGIENGLRRNSLKNAESFKYLDSIMTTSCNCPADISVWKNKNVSKATKMRLYHVLIVSIALYGLEKSVKSLRGF